MKKYRKFVKEFYSQNKEIEANRLFKSPYHELEFKTTMHFLEKYLPKKAFILDAGGGPGAYTVELAKRGHEIILLDLSPELLKIAKERIKENTVENNVKGLINACVTNLSMFRDDTFDAVLCLGSVLNHIMNEKDREKTVKELVRVTKPNGLIFISVISRIALIVNTLVQWKDTITEEYKDRVFETGDYFGERGFTYAHFFLPEELEKLLKNKGVVILEKVGLEGLASTHEKEYNELAEKYPERAKKWWEWHLKTCTRESAVDISEHFMFVCRKIKH